MFKNLLLGLLVLVVFFLYTSKNKQDGVQPMYTETTKTGSAQILPEVVPSNETMDLSGQALTRLSSDIFDDTSIKFLDVSNNKLSGALPSEIGKLVNLRVLDASDNEMTGVPAEVGKLSNLVELDLSNNNLTGLPYELGNLKNLKVLNLSGNAYSKQDLEVIKKGLSPDIELIL